MMKKILLLLANGFEAVEASAFTDVFGWNKWEGDGSTELVTVGLRSELTCTWNFKVIPEKTIQEIHLEEFDALAIPGGFEEAGFYEDAFSEEFSMIVQYFHAAQKPIACICVASLILGNSGILADRKATTYDFPTSNRKSQLKAFGANVQDQRLVIDEHIITSSNPSTSFDTAFALLEMVTSKENVQNVKQLMGFYEK